jgi:hypothetical protein
MVELILIGACLTLRGIKTSAFTAFPLLPSLTRTSDKAEDTTRNRILSKIRNLCNHFATKMSWKPGDVPHGALMASLTVLVNAPRIPNVTCKSPLID